MGGLNFIPLASNRANNSLGDLKTNSNELVINKEKLLDNIITEELAIEIYES